MNILAIETSTEACSAALLHNNKITLEFDITPQRHSQPILPMCDALLKQSGLSLKDLDAIAFAQGPGSFTGIRIAAGVTQGIAFGADLPVIAISTLEALAHQALKKHNNASVLVAIDARMSEVYWAEYSLNKDNSIMSLCDEQVTRPSAVCSSSNQEIIAIGSGWKEYKSEFEPLVKEKNITNIYSDALPSAELIVELAKLKWQKNELLTAEQAVPVYLRNDVAKKSIVKK